MMGNIDDFLEKYRHNRKMLLFIVYVALFLDNMLLTAVVPIMPEYLYRLEHPNDTSIYGETSQSPCADLQTSTQSDDLPYNDYYDQNTDDYLPEKTAINSNIVETSTLCNRPEQNSTIDLEEQERRHEYLTRENVHVGLMFGSKALIQLITNPLVGPLTNSGKFQYSPRAIWLLRIGYTVPMFGGFVIMFLSTLLFAFGTSYGMLFFARTLQGIGSACTSSSGMGMLAHAYPDDEERGAAMGIALGGLALGVLIGPPFGGVMYEYTGKELPFIILAMLALFDGTLQLLVLKPRIEKGDQEGSSMKALIKDPYIGVAAGAITVGNLGIAMLEPSLPLWMMETMRANSATRGVAFLPASISYMVGTNIFGPLAHKMGRWLSAFIGLLIIGICLLDIPSARSVYGLILPNGFMGLAIGMIDASMFPQMGFLVDLRHVGVYGSIYAIADAAFCFAFALGPFFSGPLVKGVGFPTMLYVIAIINFLYAPLMLFLRNPPATSSETERLVPSSPSKSNGGRYEQLNNNYGGYNDESNGMIRPQMADDLEDYGY